MIKRIDAIVIGAGHNGLVCAATLARAGLNVVCVEASESAGGMSAPRSLGDYHFPGLAHASYPVSPTIRRSLKLERFGYAPGGAINTVALDANGQHLILTPDSVAGETVSDADKAAYPEFRKNYLEFAAALRPLLENKPPRLKNMAFADKATLARLGWKLRMGLGRESMYEFLRVAAINIYDVLNETFDNEQLKAAIALDAVMGNAMGPRSPGTVLTWLQSLYGEQNGSLSLQSGGASQLVHALTGSAEDAGVDIRLNTRVRRILVENGKAFGVELENGDLLKAKTIVSNADPRATFLELVGAPQLDTMFANRVTQIRGSGVVGKLHLALTGLPEFTGLAESHLGDRLLIAPTMRDIEHAFNHSKYQEASEHLVFEITLPSVHNPSLAPEGHHVMSVNVAYVPYEIAGGWAEQQTTFTYRLISQLGAYAPNLKTLIADHEFLTPRDIESEYGAVRGHWHHGEMTIHQSFMMRPVHGAAQYDTPVDGLYLCGAGAHPGGGLTGLPGYNAARRILKTGTAK